jgi:hypothetical protein
MEISRWRGATGTLTAKCPRPERAAGLRLGNKHWASVCRSCRGLKSFAMTFPMAPRHRLISSSASGAKNGDFAIY